MRIREAIAFSTCALFACSHHQGAATDNDGGTSQPDATPLDAAYCGGQHLDLSYVPPNLGIVLDRSCSMTKALAGTTTTKWQAAVAALRDVLTTYATDVRWGLTMFPDTAGSACTQGTIPFPIGVHSAHQIEARLQAALGSGDADYPDDPCVTPIDTGVEQAATDPALADTDRKSYLLLVTDGAQAGCSAGGSAAGAEDAVAQLFTAGIATYVVGFGSEVKASELDTLAVAGGVPNTGSNAYYQADTAAELDAVFQQIASQVVSCTYQVSQAPPDLAETYVIFGGNTLVPYDPSNTSGWDYDPAMMTLTLYGAYCSELKTHAVSSFDVLFGCPSPPIF